VLPHFGPGPEGVDECQMRAVGRCRNVVEQRLATGVHAVGPAALRGPCIQHAHTGACDDDVVSGQEALFLAGEQLVEVMAGDTRQRGHMRNRRGLVAALRYRLDHGLVQPRALLARDFLVAHATGSMGSSAIRRCELSLRSTHDKCARKWSSRLHVEVSLEWFRPCLCPRSIARQTLRFRLLRRPPAAVVRRS
jgi:hypothetical protein